jgi:hypothetical protein
VKGARGWNRDERFASAPDEGEAAEKQRVCRQADEGLTSRSPLNAEFLSSANRFFVLDSTERLGTALSFGSLSRAGSVSEPAGSRIETVSGHEVVWPGSIPYCRSFLVNVLRAMPSIRAASR